MITIAPADGRRRLRAWARNIKRDVVALSFAARDRRVPRLAKAIAAAVAAYAISPVDLIPDFIPVLGYLDELVLLPLGIMLAVWLIPTDIMAEHRSRAVAAEGRAVSRAAGIAVVTIWIAMAAFLTWLFWPGDVG